MIKKCVKCSLTFPLELFKKNLRRKDGRDSYCKKCHVQNTLKARRNTKISIKKDTEYCIKTCRKHGQLKYEDIGLIIYNSVNPMVVDMTCLLCKDENQRKKYNNNHVINNMYHQLLKCYVCFEEKHISNFYRSELKRKSPACTICIQKKQKNIKMKNLLKRRFNISLHEYESILKSQNYVCKICKGVETRRHRITKEITKLAVDHCHITGKIRGLLCSCCNLMIGNARDSIDILKSGIKYLEYQTVKTLSNSSCERMLGGIEKK